MIKYLPSFKYIVICLNKITDMIFLVPRGLEGPESSPLVKSTAKPFLQTHEVSYKKCFPLRRETPK